MPWSARAACKGHDPEDWMDGRPGLPTAAARAVCAACPVRAACLAHALVYDEPWGMWGGLSTRERIAGRLGLPAQDHGGERPYIGANGPRKTKPPPTQRVS
ncbi:WhiB family transcriptional regulator [Blastococcus sp. CT_GayMR16]|uniref:WhiB family transcriptional regulator n=1 Tax=Blastococcus sp. CT_GayMR16 TaxID=2559607 RepID=UPI0010731F45|nr:WhiB family transcriptional regulator [Blastococcus sp. CT_GayMR16]TFV89600.1 WhiB family transcriptional regulator [Blastococcus sp. CT_GayMR16]